MKREIIVFALCIIVFSVQFPIGHTFYVNEVALPDLTVTDFWREGDFIYYQIMNVGDDLASGVHLDALFINNEEAAENNLDRSLMPGGRYEGMFPFNWEAAIDPSVSVRVQTDVNNSIIESNETNNSMEKIWKTDSTPPVFLSEPTVDSLTATSAVISWSTDEYSNSLVEYGKASGIYDLAAADMELVTFHSVTLSELDVYTTYHFMVKSADTDGNTALSGENMFQTISVSDNIIPTLSMENITNEVQGKVNIQPAVFDDIGIEKVEFSIDGVVLFSAYSPPYILPLDTSNYMNGPHTLEARVFDLAGNSQSDQKTVDIANVEDRSSPIVVIESPGDGDLVGGIVKVKAYLTDDVGLSAARFYVNGSYEGFTPLQHSTTDIAYFDYDVTNLEEGAKITLAVEGWDTDSPPRTGTDNVRVFVHNAEPEPSPTRPILEVSKHTVKRYNNEFAITLEVRNVGDQAATDVRIIDGVKGFQPISTLALDAEYSAYFSPMGKTTGMLIHSKVPILAGESHTYAYDAVPVLLSPCPMIPSLPTPEIGFFIDLYWNSTLSPGDIEYHDFVQLPVALTESGETILKAHEEAVRTCNYLIVTDPWRLILNYAPTYTKETIFGPSQSTRLVNMLLSTMATLALYRGGVLGYFWASSVVALKNLIKPGGDWAQRMRSDFNAVLWNQWVCGSVLIVGEDEIVPSLHTSNWGIKWTDGSVTNDVPLCDQYYADTSGNYGCPELNVGRIIGNTPSDLINAIWTSASVVGGASGYGYDFSKATLLSGIDGTDDFVNSVNDVDSILKKKGLSTLVVHRKDWPDDLTAFVEFEDAAQYADVVYMSAHGLPDSCDFVTDLRLAGIDFKGSNPIVFAASCLTGNYETGDLAEVFFDRGAGLYIGATQDSPGNVNSEGSKKFFDWLSVAGAGVTLSMVERVFSTMGNEYRYWIAEYNVYGDPLFGFPSIASSSMMPTQSSLQETPSSSIDVSVPDFVNTTVGSFDHVEIPNGILLFDVDRPQVPIYYTIVNYPKGVEVQNVILGQRSGLTTGSGLNLPITSMEFDSVSSGNEVFSGADDGWYPKKDYDWKVLENSDGTTTLFIWMYPFYYNALTTDFRFYGDYHFDISYNVSQVEITELLTDQDVYRQGDPLKIDTMLMNIGPSQDVIVDAVLRRSDGGREEFVYGFPLRTLEGFKTGAASFSEECDTTGFVPGYYYAEVTLKDTDGDLLDKKIRVFRLGFSSIEITDFTAAPAYFGLGNEVHTRMTLRNNGTVDISGTAVMRILDLTGQLVQEFKNAIVDLSPSADIAITNVWNTSGAVEGSYSIIGYVRYNDEVSDIQVATVQTDYVPPAFTIETPLQDATVQDGVDFTISATDQSGVASMMVSIRSAEGEILSLQYESMPTTLEQDGKWRLYFDTRQLPDDFYTLIANGTDVLGNWGVETVRFSVRNWVAVELLPSGANYKAGRTVPIKFAIRVNASVDPTQPFVYNEELTINICLKTISRDVVLQTSRFGNKSTDYRIDYGKLYITNFRTLDKPANYVVKIYRKDVLISSFEFSTFK